MQKINKFDPYGDLVVVERIKKPEKTKSGIIIVSEDETPEDYARVIRIGKKVTDIDVGDKVILGQHIGQNFKLEGTDYQILHETDILAIIYDSSCEDDKIN